MNQSSRQIKFFGFDTGDMVDDLCDSIEQFICDAIDCIHEKQIKIGNDKSNNNSLSSSFYLSSSLVPTTSTNSGNSFRNYQYNNSKFKHSDYAYSLKMKAKDICKLRFDGFERYIERNIFVIPQDLDLSSSSRYNNNNNNSNKMICYTKEKENELDEKIRAAHERLREIVHKQKKILRDKLELETSYTKASQIFNSLEESKGLLNQEEIEIVMKNGEQLKKLSGLIESKIIYYYIILISFYINIFFVDLKTQLNYRNSSNNLGTSSDIENHTPNIAILSKRFSKLCGSSMGNPGLNTLKTFNNHLLS